MFGNIAEVTRLSGDFLTALEESSRNEEAVGGVFMTYSSRLREVYAVYCRNHDTAAALLEKVREQGNPKLIRFIATITAIVKMCVPR